MNLFLVGSCEMMIQTLSQVIGPLILPQTPAVTVKSKQQDLVTLRSDEQTYMISCWKLAGAGLIFLVVSEPVSWGKRRSMCLSIFSTDPRLT